MNPSIELRNTIRVIKDEVLNRIELSRQGDYLVYTDEYGRRWKLEPLKDLNIQIPFRILPLPADKEKE